MNRPTIPKQVLDYQKQVLEFQKAAFENGYNAIVALQERQLELADRMIDQVPNLPDEARTLMQTWRDAAAEGQQQFKNTVDGSFAAITTYLDRLADGSPAEDPAVETEAAE
ncbi:MAG: hypothetical protein OXG81_11420 [Acidobacteria bacterium]|nr:hypothetical protein [Acidobacteriota bacterium]MCY3963675.1 hypothetical protein [Acidobacteriota bacterium]